MQNIDLLVIYGQYPFWKPQALALLVVKYFECCPYTTHKESLGILDVTFMLLSLKLYYCTYVANSSTRKKFDFVSLFFSEVPQRSVNSCSMNPSGTEGQHWKSNLGNMLTNSKQRIWFLYLQDWQSEKRNDGGGVQMCKLLLNFWVI